MHSRSQIWSLKNSCVRTVHTTAHHTPLARCAWYSHQLPFYHNLSCYDFDFWSLYLSTEMLRNFWTAFHLFFRVPWRGNHISVQCQNWQFWLLFWWLLRARHHWLPLSHNGAKHFKRCGEITFILRVFHSSQLRLLLNTVHIYIWTTFTYYLYIMIVGGVAQW